MRKRRQCAINVPPELIDPPFLREEPVKEVCSVKAAAWYVRHGRIAEQIEYSQHVLDRLSGK